jgi:hypothetical protein
MLRIVFSLALLVGANDLSVSTLGSGTSGSGGHPSDTQLSLDDNVQLTMGDSDDITLHYDSADTRFELANATGLVLRIDDGSVAVVPNAQAHFEDDVLLSFGDTAAAPDVWVDDNGTYFCLTSTSVDGGGTDGDLFCYVLGGNALQLDVTTLIMSNDADVDLKDNDSSALSFDTADKAGLLNFDTTDGDEGIGTSGWFALGAGTKLSSSVDGDLLITNNTGTQGIYLDTQTANALGIRNQVGGATSLFNATAWYFGSSVSSLSPHIATVSDYMQIYGYYGVTARHIGDLTANGHGIFEVGQANANAELSGSSGTQYGMSLGNATIPFEVNQSGTAGYHALHIDVTETSLGSGDHDLLNAGVGGSEKFAVDNTGDMTITGTIKTEVASGAVPAEPHACDAAHSGVIVTVDDTDDTAYNEPCVCLNLDGTGYDWRQLSDVTGTACPSF